MVGDVRVAAVAATAILALRTADTNVFVILLARRGSRAEDREGAVL